MTAKKAAPRPYGPVTIRSGGQLTLPIELRRDLKIEETDRYVVYGWAGGGDRRMLLLPEETATATLDKFLRSQGFVPLNGGT
jgi:bifunctional DNA-binding transcriptional regulator/antitoxin component of YhaV-PrlF toxin-antitoxin module